ncbi:NAD(P)-binding protein [Mollisia scopiformis]|uniref:NAD(P)-binding protein n=1 Tax=Mollisia scopiformis TaxID=149040 RepID=A0A194WSV2_MOLSC|nr:NAD(P)-binding protein [Mollisia scopiformis]KUJ11031.1 NAD(P)-binding protein [Mollisia scopiformis]
MAITKVLLTGASGYIGGAVLAQILKSNHDDVRISALVRSSEHADIIRNLGVESILFKGLDQLDLIKASASEHDLVISCASAMDLPSCLALVEGLAQRRASTGTDVHYIHTSGTLNFGDHPITGKSFLGIRTDKDDIFSWEKETQDDWLLRKVDIGITEAGLRFGVKTYIVNPPIIYGIGNGPIHKQSLQIPALINLSLGFKQAVVLGDGHGIWTIIHISDAARLYDVILQKFLQKQPIDSGRKGYYFVEAGETTWKIISQAIARAGHSQGLFASAELKQLSPETFVESLGIPFLNAGMVEVIWGSNSRIKGIKSRELGWRPEVPIGIFADSIVEDFNIISQNVSA